MRLFRTFRTAIHALSRNVMRAVLTTLGIIIGVVAVIVMVEIGNGASTAIQNTIASMGANNLAVYPGTATSGGGISMGSGSVNTLNYLDAEAIRRECPAVENVAPVIRTRTQVIYGNRNWVPMYIYGSTPEFLDVRDWNNLAEGEPFTDRDVRNVSKVCLLGKTLVTELFGDESPIGKEVRVQSVSLRVIGVLSSKGANMMGFDQDDILLAPWTTVKQRISNASLGNVNQSAVAKSDTTQQINTLNKLYPGSSELYPIPSAAQLANTPLPVRFTKVDQIMVSTISPKELPEGIKQITQALRERHRIKPGEPEDFNVRDMTELTKALASSTLMITTLLLVVAAASLVVGGVGIMNIMLVSVTERTREIGLRMAVGARGRDILLQFLVEAVILCLSGGAIGIGLGRLASYVVSSVLHWQTQVSIPAIFISVAVSASVGILFGFYPAWKASRLDPIEALRYE